MYYIAGRGTKDEVALHLWADFRRRPCAKILLEHRRLMPEVSTFLPQDADGVLGGILRSPRFKTALL